MNKSRQILLSFAVAMVALTGPAEATQPPDVVQSDGYDNTAMGNSALLNLNSSGYANTAAGAYALLSNTSGSWNVAFGTSSLPFNTTGIDNSAFGADALLTNTTGSENTAVGDDSLYFNSTGYDNTAAGVQSLFANTSGHDNSAFGLNALNGNTTGYLNVAVGEGSLFSNTTGAWNTAVGGNALSANTIGSGNAALGKDAGMFTTGSNNVDIANAGVAGENLTIRIGNTAHMAAYIAGINNSHVVGAPVYVTPAGRLGVAASSERYKTAIAPMESSTANLDRLRPVTFHLKSDPLGVLQYGLIAEEVDKVYPELVIRDAAGNIEGVRYDELAPMLLNKVQQQQKTIAALEGEITAQARKMATQDSEITAQQGQLRDLRMQMADLLEANRSIQLALKTLQPTESRVALR